MARIHAGIRRHRAACGCELGSLCLIGAAILYLSYVALIPAEWSAGETIWRGVAWVLAAAVVGKLVGLAYAGLRLQMYRSALRRELRGPRGPYPDVLDRR